MDFFPHRHLLGIKGLTEQEITYLLDRADEAVKISRQREKKTSTLRGLTQINLFFEASTRTQSSFELAGKRLGADVMNMSVGNSSVKKGETLIDTAMTLNAMHPDVLVVRHSSAGAAALLAQKVSCSVKPLMPRRWRCGKKSMGAPPQLSWIRGVYRVWIPPRQGEEAKALRIPTLLCAQPRGSGHRPVSPRRDLG